MSHMICIKCGEVYDPLCIKSELDDPLSPKSRPNLSCGQFCYGGFCPIFSCGGRVIECDDLILSTVYNLNRKGYTTSHSDSGHPGGKVSDTHVSFNCLVTDMDKVIEVILEEYTYTIFEEFGIVKKYETGPLRFSVEGYMPGSEFISTSFTRSANFENWTDVIKDFEILKNKCSARDLCPVLFVRPYTKNDTLFPNYRGMNINNYPIIGAGHHLLYDINNALYEMTTRLPDELSIEKFPLLKEE